MNMDKSNMDKSKTNESNTIGYVFTFMFAFLMLVASASIASAASVGIFSAYDSTTNTSLSIVDGQSVGFVVSADSVLEPSMTIKVELIDGTGHAIATLIDTYTVSQSYSSHYVLTKAIYHDAGAYKIRSTVTAASGQTSVSILDLNVVASSPGNNPPYFISNPIIAINEGLLYSYLAVAVDPENSRITYSLTQAPSWLSINPTTGLVSGTAPQVANNTNYAVTISATDGTYSVIQTYTLTVMNIAAPTSSVSAALIYDSTNLDTLNVTNGANAGFIVYANSAYETSMTIKVELLNSNGSTIATLIDASTVNSSYSSHYTLTQAIYGGIGSYTIKETVTGVSGATSIAMLKLNVVSAPITNQPPVITSTPVTAVNEIAAYNYQIIANDPENATLSYSLTQAPSWLSINPTTGLVSGTAPQVAADTNFNITVAVSDGIYSVEQRYILTVLDIPAPIRSVDVNISYTNTASDMLTILNGTSVQINLTAASVNEPNMTLAAALYDSSGTAISNLLLIDVNSDSYSNILALSVADYVSTGNYTIFALVIGASGTVDMDQLALEVITPAGMNNPPIIISAPITSADVGSAYNYQVIATDADNDTLTYSMFGPAWLSINPATGLVSGTVPITAIDTDYDVIVFVSDGTYTVRQPYVLTGKTIPFTVSVSANPSSGIAPLAVMFSSIVTGIGPFTYAWDFDNDGSIDSNAQSPSFTYMNPGNFVAKLIVTDSFGRQNVNTIRIIVQTEGGESVSPPSVSKQRISIESIIYDEMINSGDETQVLVNTRNIKATKGAISVMIPDLGIVQKYSSTDMSLGARTASKFSIDIPADTKPGTYDLMVVVYQDGQKRIKYRTIEIR